MFVGDGVGYVDFEFHPVGVFLESQAFHVCGVVGIVVDGGHGAQLVESFYQHAFGIHVGEAQGALDVGHAPFASPLFDGADQCFGHFCVVREVYPSEAHFLFAPCLVGAVVDDGGHASHQLAVFVGQEVVGFAKLESGVFLFAECAQHVVVEVGHGVGIVFVQFVVEADEPLEVPSVGYFLDGYSHDVLLCLFGGKDTLIREEKEDLAGGFLLFVISFSNRAEGCGQIGMNGDKHLDGSVFFLRKRFIFAFVNFEA